MVGEFFAGTGLTRLIDVVVKIQKRLNPSLEIAGVFFLGSITGRCCHEVFLIR
jgi:hypothetical protein